MIDHLLRRPLHATALHRMRILAQLGMERSLVDRVLRHHAEGLHVEGEAGRRALRPVLDHAPVGDRVERRVRLDGVEPLGVVPQPGSGRGDVRTDTMLRSWSDPPTSRCLPAPVPRVPPFGLLQGQVLGEGRSLVIADVGPARDHVVDDRRPADCIEVLGSRPARACDIPVHFSCRIVAPSRPVASPGVGSTSTAGSSAEPHAAASASTRIIRATSANRFICPFLSSRCRARKAPTSVRYPWPMRPTRSRTTRRRNVRAGEGVGRAHGAVEGIMAPTLTRPGGPAPSHPRRDHSRDGARRGQRGPSCVTGTARGRSLPRQLGPGLPRLALPDPVHAQSRGRDHTVRGRLGTGGADDPARDGRGHGHRELHLHRAGEALAQVAQFENRRLPELRRNSLAAFDGEPTPRSAWTSRATSGGPGSASTPWPNAPTRRPRPARVPRLRVPDPVGQGTRQHVVKRNVRAHPPRRHGRAPLPALPSQVAITACNAVTAALTTADGSTLSA